MGGIYVEVLRDVTFRLAPVLPLGARHMIESVRGFPLLQGVRGEPPSDTSALAEAIERVSQLAVEIPEVVELDLNPLIVRLRRDRSSRVMPGSCSLRLPDRHGLLQPVGQEPRAGEGRERRCGAAAPMMTETWPAGTRPTRCHSTVAWSPNSRRAARSSFLSASSAGPSCAS